MNDAPLRTGLLDLLHALGQDANGVLLGGGYGLYLKQLHVAEAGQRTLIRAEFWPAPRATQDLDLLLPTELVADARLMGIVRTALDRLDYKVVPGSEHLQFLRKGSGLQEIKIDLLTAQLDVLRSIPGIEADSRRARPNVSDRPSLHAHPTDGALAFSESPLVIEVVGSLTAGTPYAAQVKIPHPFSYLLMKLTAYRDRRTDAQKDLGRHHALDVFRIVAMLTEAERDQVQENMKRFTEDVQVRSCADLVRADFAHANAPGILAMRQHQLWRNDAQLDVFIETLQELFA